MSIGVSELSAADIAAITGNNGGNNNGGDWGANSGWWIIILLLALGRGFGYGGNDGGGQGGGGQTYTQPIVIDSGRSGGCGCQPCATVNDLAAGFNNSAVLSNLNDLQLGQASIQQTLCQGFSGVNQTVNTVGYQLSNGLCNLGYNIQNGFNGIDRSISNLGYHTQDGFNGISRQIADCCCDTRAAIKDVAYGNAMNTSAIQRQISDCCCDLEKANMQNRFDAQAYNANTLQAIDRVGDRIIDYMSKEKMQTLRDENQALRLAASQANQNALFNASQEAQTAELIRRLGRDNPVPAFIVPNPNCCYQYNVQPVNNCCNTGCGGSF